MTKSNLQEVDELLNKDLLTIALKYSPPAIIGMVLYGANAFIDNFFVSHLIGEVALSAVSIVIPLIQIFLGCGVLIGTGVGILYSTAIGANNEIEKNAIWSSLIWCSLIISILVTIMTYFFTYDLIKVLGGNNEIIREASNFFEILSLGSFFTIYGIASNMLLRGEGKIQESTLLAFIGVILNIILNPVMIKVLDQGIKGSAYATVFSNFILSVATTIYFLRIHPTFKKNSVYTFNKKIVIMVLKSGFSSFIMWIFTITQSFVIFRIISFSGNNSDIAFYGMVNRTIGLLSAPIFGLVRALQPIIGLNFGAGKLKRVFKSFKLFLILGQSLMFIIWAPFNFYTEQVIRYMLPNYNIDKIDIKNFRISLLSLMLLPCLLTSLTLFQNIKCFKITNLLILSRYIIFFIPALYLLFLSYGLNSIYSVPLVVDLLLIPLCFYFFKNQVRKLKSNLTF